jgi:PAS domain S-box-containing protein
MRHYNDITKSQLIEEIESQKKRIEELEQSEFKHKQTEQILKANEIKLRNILEYSTNLFYSHTPDHVLTYISPQTREFFDCEPEEAKVRWTEFLTENPNNEIGLILTAKAIETGKVQPSYELELIGKKGRKLWVEVNEAPVVEGGQTVAIVGALTDITERKQSEMALQKSEEKYRLLFESIPDGITTIDEQGAIISANKSVKRILGYEPSELLGKQVEILAPEELRPEQKENIFKAINKGFLGSQETIRVAKDGTRIPIDISVFSSKDSTGNLLGVSAIMRDITDRKQVEAKLGDSLVKVRNLAAHLQTIREEERASIARNIHDDMGQILTTLKINLSLIENEIQSNEKPVKQLHLLEELKDMQDIIDNAIVKVRKLIRNLRPEVLDNLGLLEALKWQTDEFENRNHIKCLFTSNVTNIKLDKDKSTAIFRILQEVLTNVLRHSKATVVKINVNKKNSKFLLKIIDNGIGFSKKKIFGPNSFGLLGMRERALVFGGQMEIITQKGKGTTVTLSIPFS